MCPFWDWPSYSQNSWYAESPGSSWAPYRETPISRTFFYTFLSNSPFPQSPQEMTLPPYSPSGSLWIHVSSPEPIVYSFIHIHQSPQFRNPPTKTGITFVYRFRGLHGDIRATYSGVWPGSPTGLFTTLLSLPSAMQPSARYLPP